jgi:hypothetical protein
VSTKRRESGTKCDSFCGDHSTRSVEISEEKPNGLVKHECEASLSPRTFYGLASMSKVVSASRQQRTEPAQQVISSAEPVLTTHEGQKERENNTCKFKQHWQNSFYKLNMFSRLFALLNREKKM